MKRAVKFECFVPVSRLTLIQSLTFLILLYLLFITLEIPLVFKTRGSVPDDTVLRRPLLFAASGDSDEGGGGDDDSGLASITATVLDSDPSSYSWVMKRTPGRRMRETKKVSGLFFNETTFDTNDSVDEFSVLHKAAKEAWLAGKKLWDELESGKLIQANQNFSNSADNRTEQECPVSIALSGSEFSAKNRTMEIPCGMTLGSHITAVASPTRAHLEKHPEIAKLREGEEALMVSQFMMELQGLKTVDGEEPPRIFHFNPRLKGDWSGKPVIEQNTCYRMKWGDALRCEGWSSRPDEETVDGQVKCEKWLRDNDGSSEDSKATWWLNRLIGRKKKISYNWPFPFVEGKLFVLTVSAGLEGYQINVDGRHITSFPYRTGFVLEDATGLYLNGDVDVHSVFAASLPSSHPSFAPKQHLKMSKKWRAPPVPDEPVELFIGILSAGTHFAERMAVRKTWMQHTLIRSSKVVARFFVALNGRIETNVEVKKEADYFGDIVIIPYMDSYDLVVLKTVAICEYGVHVVAANYIMKCDDDTFVRVDVMINEAKKVQSDQSIYIGNINYYHKPFRSGKWAVTFEEWPEDEYPPYANGPGYIVSSDIAGFIVEKFQSRKLRLFRMEDVSMGMWVKNYNNSKPVEYVHSSKFVQPGCDDDYYTAHYQSPKQMLCLWDKLHQGKPECCNMR